MKRSYCWFIVMMMVIASGCASTKMQTNMQFDPRMYAADTKEMKMETAKAVADYLLEPIDSTGFRETEPMRKGIMTTREVVLPERLLAGELYPGRIRWNAIAITPDGREFFAQVGYVFRTLVLKTGTVRFIGGMFIDGTEADLADAKIIGISTKGSFGYDLSATEKEFPVDWKRFKSEPAYRNQLTLTNGTPVASLRPAEYLIPMVNGWNRYTSERGHLLSPLGEREIKEIAGINPKYSYSQKWADTGKMVISTDPIGTGTGILIDLFKAAISSSKGWDFESRDKKNDEIRAKYLEETKARAMQLAAQN